MWATDPDSAAFSDAEAARFEQDLKTALADLRTRRLAGGSLAQVRMVARGLREQLELTDDLLTRGMDAIKELEARLEARRQPLQATMATVQPDPGRRRQPPEEDPALPGGHASWTAIPARWGKT